jgi:hypothetical protein
MWFAAFDHLNFEVRVGSPASLICSVTEECRYKIDYRTLQLQLNKPKHLLNSSFVHDSHGVRLYVDNVTGDANKDLPRGRNSITCKVGNMKQTIAVCVSGRSFMTPRS